MFSTEPGGFFPENGILLRHDAILIFKQSPLNQGFTIGAVH